MNLYSFANVTTLVNLVQITGFADGDGVIDVEFPETATSTIGADGKMVVSLSADKSMKATLKLQQTSKGNRYLNSLLTPGRVFGPKMFVPIMLSVKDAYRNDLIIGARGFITKPPRVTRGVEANDVEWSFQFENGSIDLGDPTFSGLASAVAEAAGAVG